MKGTIQIVAGLFTLIGGIMLSYYTGESWALLIAIPSGVLIGSGFYDWVNS